MELGTSDDVRNVRGSREGGGSMSPTKQLFLPLLPPALVMPSRRCESCAVWAKVCSIPGKITSMDKQGRRGPVGPCWEAMQFNQAQGAEV
jgi:hypothetical protein